MNEDGMEKFEHNEMFIRHSLMLYLQGGTQAIRFKAREEDGLNHCEVNYLLTTKTLHFCNI